jgi:membrane protein DedA with SNARE-associated domain
MATWVMKVMHGAGYPALVFLMFLENVFPPIPSELIMPLAGYMVTHGQLSFVGVVLAGTLGSVLGALLLYYAGRALGEERVMEWADRHGRWVTLSRKDLERAKRWFARHGGMAVLFCRLIPGVRSLISIPAGIERMPVAAFLAYTTVGAGLWTTFLASLGYGLGGKYKEVEQYLDPASYVVLGVIVVLYLVRVVRHEGQAPPLKEETRCARASQE